MDAALLIQKRGRILGSLINAASFIKNVHDEILTEEIEARLLKVQSWWESFYNIEDQLLLLPQQTSKSDEFEEKFFETTCAMIQEIKRRNPAEPNMPNDDLNATVSNIYYQQRAFLETFNRIINENSDVKRPTSNIPPFDGKYTQWPSFKDLFEAKLHYILQDPVEQPSYTKETNNNVSSICATKSEESQPDSSTLISFTTKSPSHVNKQSILPTVVITTTESKGKIYQIRAILDSGSESTFITEHLTKKLGLKRKHAGVTVNGWSSIAAGRTTGMVNLKLSSTFDCSKFVFVDALILNKLTTSLPSQSVIFCEHLSSKISYYRLADPTFNESKSIEMILGIDVFYEIVKERRISIQHNLHVIDSLFGCIIGGFFDDSIKSVTGCYTSEESPDQPCLSDEDAFTFNIAEISSSKFTTSFINFKNLLQYLRLTKIEWDDPIPEGVNRTWCSIRNELSSLTAVCIPRYLLTQPKTNIIQYQGSSEASERAYSAEVYIRASNTDGECFVLIIASKTNVAPLKQLYVPRLELCGAVLLTKLFYKFSDISQVPIGLLYAGTDSSIILSWLSNVPRKWNCFAANRTSFIIEKLPNYNWHHVLSSFNPADCTSRGILPSERLKHSICWNGPEFMKMSQHDSFRDDIQQLQKHASIKGDSRRRAHSFHPFIDENGTLRVGGRHQNSNIPFSKEHLAVLPRRHQLEGKIMKHLHYKHVLHLNQSTLLFTSRIYAS